MARRILQVAHTPDVLHVAHAPNALHGIPAPEPLDVAHAPDSLHVAHLEEARRVLALPLREGGLHWHPFGVFTVPLAKRTVDGTAFSRRLHVWHPDARPVGEASPYGVHTHTGAARSHVLAGALQHHLYAFRPDGDGTWRRSPGQELASLEAHAQAATPAGTTHSFPAHQPHGVGTRGAFSISLFEQSVAGRGPPFTTWQRTDVEPEPLVHDAPVAPRHVLEEARGVVEAALFAVAVLR